MYGGGGVVVRRRDGARRIVRGALVLAVAAALVSCSGTGPPDGSPALEVSPPGSSAAPRPPLSVPGHGEAPKPTVASPSGPQGKAAPGRASSASGTLSSGQEAADDPVTLIGEVQARGTGTATVRTASGTTMVSWGAGTAVLDTVSAKRSDVRKGVCVVASSALVAPGEQRTGPGGSDEVVWVLVSAPVDGHCPTLAPQAPGASGAARLLSGLVTGVKGPVVTLETVGVGRPKAQARIAMTTKAAVFRTVDATAAAVGKGRCVVIQGERDANGRIAATAVTVSNARSGCGA